jgi:hypothetical protein
MKKFRERLALRICPWLSPRTWRINETTATTTNGAGANYRVDL